MAKKRIAYLIAAICLAVFRAYPITDPSTAHVKVISVNDGLPDNSINDLVEDEYGFIWIATWNGLARFDGKYIVSYRHEGGETPNYLSDMVRCIKPDKEGLWLGSDIGLDFFRYSDNKYYPSYVTGGKSGEETVLKTRVSRIMRLPDNVFALTVEGDILKLDRSRSASDGSRPVFRILPRPRSRRYADLSEFTGGKLMALSTDGITLLSPDGENELVHNSFRLGYDANLNMFFDKRGMMVIVGGGVGNETREFKIDRYGNLTSCVGSPYYSNLMSVASDGDILYYGTDGNGMVVRQNDTLVRFTPDNSPLPCDAIYKVFVDSNHNLWVGSYRHGVFMLSHNLNAYSVMDKHSGKLCYDIVTAVIPDGDRLYLGLDGGGIEVLDTKTGSYRQYNKSNSLMPADNVVSIAKDGETIWAAVYGTGLVECNTAAGQFRVFKASGMIEPGNKLWVMKDDGEGNLWIGGSSLSVFNKRSHEFNVIDGTQGSDVLSMAIDGNTVMIATRWNGLMQIDRNRRSIAERHSDSPSTGGVKLPGRKIPFVFIDSRHSVWVDVDNAMLCKIDLAAKRISKVFKHRANETGIQVLSMVEDNRGNILIGTNRGLMKYVAKRDALISLNDERMPRMFTFNAVAKDNDAAYFGTTSGLLRYPLAQASEKKELSPVVFTGIELFNNGGENVPLFSTGDTLVELDNDQNFIKVNFTVPEMTNPDRIKFECRLEGFESEWRDVSETRSAIYTYTPAGTYRMSVRHTNPDGSWSRPAGMTIKIRPAWYATTFMLIVWVVLALSILTAVALIWHKFIKNREKIRIAEVERDSANRLNEAKLDFYANITHELRTPCFLISAQIEEMYDSGRQSIPVNNLFGIYRNSAKLNRLISHIIDFRKSDTGHLSLNVRRIDVKTFLGELAGDYEQLCRQKSLTFAFDSPESPVEADIDSDKLELIVTNLISNAYKYTHKGGSVVLGLKDNGETIEISVADNGIGIVEKLQSKIFEPFVRTERGKKESSGDGIGLAFVNELVKLLHGTITVESKVNEGSRFVVTLPKKQNGVADEAALPVEKVPSKHNPELLKPEVQAPAEKRISDPTATRSILIIDDNKDVLSVMVKAFEDRYRVTEISDAKEGVELARGGGYDVVITDLMMPDFDGHQLLKALKEDKRTRDIKVVVFSALTSEKDMLTAFDEGADAYLTKPTSLKVIVRQVERLFEQDGEGSSLSSGNYNREEQKFLLECRRIINECMTLDDFDVAMLASRLSMSHSALYKKIKSMTGMSIIDFINEYRIYKAVQLFKDGITNVQTVAEMCGFKDVKTFRETFKRKMQMPPKQYMLKIQEE
jgi:putative response regulator receiver domain protein